MSLFTRKLTEATDGLEASGSRRWIYAAYDQLSDAIGPLSQEPPTTLGLVLVENEWKARRRPYHRQKLATVLANQRHFALEQAKRGVAVHYVTGNAPFAELLRPVIERVGPLTMMEAAERELRADLSKLVRAGDVDVVPHEGWLTTPDDFRLAMKGKKQWRMDAFYRHVRKRYDLMMEGGKPLGGKFSHDADNRQPWKGEPPAPQPPRFRPDAITKEVGEMVADRFPDHPGTLDPGAIPATPAQVERLWQWALEEALPWFGPYQDAMSRHSSSLFHVRISALLHLHRLLPRRVLEEVLALDLPLATKEGFIRQVIGWREYVRHVHRETDGFRELPNGETTPRRRPGDAGWSGWAGREWKASKGGPDGGATPDALGADMPLPPAFWGSPSGLACLDGVVADVWNEGYGHHITRLMVLSNLATLLGVSPRDLTDWFWVAYTDAYDWVVEPNVLGMGTYALGDLLTTKPYVSGAAYIDRMGDYCSSCAFDPKKDCPITPLYWSFLARNRERLEGNQRVAMPLRTLARRSDEKRAADLRTWRAVRETLAQGSVLRPGAATS